MVNVLAGALLILCGVMLVVQEHPFWALIFILLGVAFVGAGSELQFLPPVSEAIRV